MAEQPVLVLAEPEDFAPRALELLRGRYEVRTGPYSRGELLAAVAGARVLWVRLGHRVDREVLDAGPGLRVVMTNTTGLNHVDLDACAARGVRVLSLRGETEFLSTIRATAEHTLGLLLALVRRVPAAAEHARGGGWQRDLFRGNELFGKTAGVVGYGRLGRIVARYLAALDMPVLAADPRLGPEDAEPGVRLVPLDELLARSEIVTLHVNLDGSTRGFFGAREFGLMRPGAWLVNTSRGELLDEAALLSALESGRLAGAALDVLCRENPAGMADSPLVAYARTHENLVVTPHIGGNTVESFEKTEVFLANRLLGLEHGET